MLATDQDIGQQTAGRLQGPAVLILVALCGIGLLLRTQHLSDISFWFDEASSWKISRFSWNEMWDAIARDAHPPVYYFVLRLWGDVVGESTAALRGLSVLFGSLSIVAAYGFVRTAFAPGKPTEPSPSGASVEFAALLAAVMIATSGMHVELSMEARPYALGTFLSLAAGILLLRAMRLNGATADWVGFTVTSVALSLLHYYGTLTVASLYFYAALRLWRDIREEWSPSTKRMAAGLALSAWALQAAWSLWLPTFLYQQARTSVQPWKPPLNWSYLENTCWSALSGGKTTPIPDGWAWIAVVAWIASVLALLRVGPKGGRLAGMCAVVPLVVATGYSLKFNNIVNVRYLIFSQTYLLIAWALLIAHLPHRWIQAVLAIVLVGWFGHWCWHGSGVRDYYASFPGVRGASAFLDQVRSPGEPILVGSPFVHAILYHHLTENSGVFVSATDRDRYDLLGGPPLRDSDFVDLHTLAERRIDRVWTVNVEGLWGRTYAVKLPEEFHVHSETRFEERFGFRMDLRVCEHRRANAAADFSPVVVARERGER